VLGKCAAVRPSSLGISTSANRSPRVTSLISKLVLDSVYEWLVSSACSHTLPAKSRTSETLIATSLHLRRPRRQPARNTKGSLQRRDVHRRLASAQRRSPLAWCAPPPPYTPGASTLHAPLLTEIPAAATARRAARSSSSPSVRLLSPRLRVMAGSRPSPILPLSSSPLSPCPLSPCPPLATASPNCSISSLPRRDPPSLISEPSATERRETARAAHSSTWVRSWRQTLSSCAAAIAAELPCRGRSLVRSSAGGRHQPQSASSHRCLARSLRVVAFSPLDPIGGSEDFRRW